MEAILVVALILSGDDDLPAHLSLDTPVAVPRREPADAASDEPHLRFPRWEDQDETKPQEEKRDSGEASQSLGDFVWTEIKRSGRDYAYLLASPLRIRGETLLPTLGVLAVVGGAFLLDEPIRGWVDRNYNASVDNALSVIEPIHSYFWIGAALLLGVVSDEKRLLEMCVTAGEAEFFALGMAEILKFGVGRLRPKDTEDSLRFRPFSGNTSFPSGHVLDIATMAAVFSDTLNCRVFDVIGYGFTALMAAQRIYVGEHWFSDAVFSAAFGIAVGKTMVALRHDPDVKILPWCARESSGDGAFGLQVVIRR